MSEQATQEQTDNRIEIVSFTIGEQAFCLDIDTILLDVGCVIVVPIWLGRCPEFYRRCI